MARTFRERFPDQTTVPEKGIVSVQMLDGSGSMQGEKWFNSVQGLKKHLEQTKELNFKSLSTIVFYGSRYTKPQVLWNMDPKTTRFDLSHPGGSTPLFYTMEIYLEKALEEFKDDQVLFSIYTDGDDTEGGARMSKLNEYITEFVKRGWTLTFVGLKHDVTKMLRTFPMLDESNTLGVENTGESYAKAFETYAVNTENYSKSFAAGADVSRGFFKSLEN